MCNNNCSCINNGKMLRIPDMNGMMTRMFKQDFKQPLKFYMQLQCHYAITCLSFTFLKFLME